MAAVAIDMEWRYIFLKRLRTVPFSCRAGALTPGFAIGLHGCPRHWVNVALCSASLRLLVGLEGVLVLHAQV